MKSYIWLQTADGSIQQVEEEVAMLCPLIYKELIHNGMGSSKNCAILLPERVNPANLGLILEFCRFHQVSGRSNKVSFLFLSKQCIPPLPMKEKQGSVCYVIGCSITWFPLSDLSFTYLGAQEIWWEVRSVRYQDVMWFGFCCWQPSAKACGWPYEPRTCSDYWRQNSWGNTWNFPFAWWSNRGLSH